MSPHPHATPDESPGNWREHEIAPFPGGMKPPPFPEVAHRMLDWVKSVNTLRDTDAQTPLPERLAQVHNMFERIHPFLDGNGRTGRPLLAVAGPARLVPLASLADRETGLTANALRVAAIRGHLQGS